MFEFLANLTNYKPKDFKGKTVQEILAMKPKNVGADFFEPANDQAIADAGLMGEQLDAIELLRDLKEKTKIFERCYKNKTQRRKPVLQKKAAPAEQAQQIEEPEQTPAVEEVTAGEQALAEQATADQYQAQQGGGGRRRHRKSKKHRGGHKHRHSDGRNCSKKHKHSGHKHSGHKHSGHKHKHSGGHKHSKKHGKKNYKGGAADMTPVVFVPALTRPPPQFRM